MNVRFGVSSWDQNLKDGERTEENKKRKKGKRREKTEFLAQMGAVATLPSRWTERPSCLLLTGQTPPPRRQGALSPVLTGEPNPGTRPTHDGPRSEATQDTPSRSSPARDEGAGQEAETEERQTRSWGRGRGAQRCPLCAPAGDASGGAGLRDPARITRGQEEDRDRRRVGRGHADCLPSADPGRCLRQGPRTRSVRRGPHRK